MTEVKALDQHTAELMIQIARQHLDRPCNSGLPQHIELELVAILQAPAEDLPPHIKSQALALLEEGRGAV